jgi:tetratricopeptide (TPR) repeat protein
MSVRTQSSQWAKNSRVVQLPEFKIVLALPVLVFVSVAALAQKPKPPITPPVSSGIDPGFRTLPTPERIALPAAQKSGNDTCLLPPLDLASSPVIAAEQLRIPSKARKEYQGACSALTKNKFPDAEKHLRKAVQEYPKYSAAWVTLGQVLAAQQRTEDARSACSQASTVDPIYVPAYLCLAEIAVRSQDWDAELKLSSRALELDPSNYAVAYEYHAAANANLHNLAQAEKSGLHAVEIDKDHREPRVHFLLAQIYEMEGDSARERQQLRQYLKYAHNPQGRALAEQMLSKLESGNGQAVDLASADTLREVSVRSAQRWGPADIDETVPPVLDDGNCPLAQIVREASNRTEDLIENLQRFSARERIEQTDIDKHGKRRNSSAQMLDYIAHIEQRSSPYPVINEYRSGSSGVQQARVVDSGTAAFALIFHPSHVGNLNFRCEGLTELQGQRAWQVRFEETADPNKAFTTMRTDSSIYAPRLKGRAWITSGSYDVLRIETDLVAPIREINLNMEHMIISYAPVEFPARHIRLWLPESAALYISYQGHRYERVHSFGQFQLFSVEVNEAIKEPAAGNDGAKE